MKFVLRFFLVIAGVYVLFIGGLSYVFHNVDRFHQEIESLASNYLGQTVSIGEIDTIWSGKRLGFYLGDIEVEDRLKPEVKFAQIKHIAAEFKLSSIFLLWPQFSNLTVERPRFMLESFTDGSFRFIGKRYQPSSGQQRRSMLMFSWLLNHKRADIHDGEFLWKHREGKQTSVEKFSAQYRQNKGVRTLYAVGQKDNQALGLSAELKGNVLWGEDWDAQANLLEGENVYTLNDKVFELLVDNAKGSIKSKEFKAQRLADIANIFGRGTKLHRWLSESKLSGVLADIEFDFSGSLTTLDTWQFKAKAQQVSWQATSEAPGLNGLNTEFLVNNEQGALVFSTQDAEFNWPKYFSKPIPVNQFSGNVVLENLSRNIDVKFENIKIDVPNLSLENTQAKFSKKTIGLPFLELKSDISTDDLLQIERFFPIQTHPDFRDWWEGAIGKSIDVAGQVTFNGFLDKVEFQSGRSILNATLKANKAYLDFGFEKDWPIFKAKSVDINVNNMDISFATDEGTVGDVQAIQPRAKLINLSSKKRELHIDGDIRGELASLVDFLQDGPLIPLAIKEARSPQQIRINKVSGKFLSKLNVVVPFAKILDTKVTGSGSVANGKFTVGELLTVNNVKGGINYTEKTVDGKNISALIFGGKTKVNVETLSPGAPPKIRINAVGNAQVEKMQQLISPQLASRFSGSSPWTGFIDIGPKGVQLGIESKLEGTKVDFPQPFAKQAETSEPLSIKFQAGQGAETQLQLNSELFSLQLQSQNQKNLFDRGLFLSGKFSKSEASEDKAIEPKLPKEGISIYANSLNSNLDDWLDVIKEMASIESEQSDKASFVERLRVIDVKPEKLTIFDKNLGQTNFRATSNNGLEWTVKVDGKYANGTGTLKPFASTPSYEFAFDRLHWPSKKELEVRGVFVPDGLIEEATGKPNAYPDVLLQARNFRIFDRDFGSLKFKASANDTAWEFQEILLESSGVEIKGTGEWFDDGSQYGMTKGSFDISSDVGGQMLKGLGFGGFLKGGNIKMKSSLFWRGAPSHFEVDRLNGDYSLDVTKGSFPKVDADSGRLLGLLNINALSRRLRLDFGDVFGKGLVFDQMKTSGILNEGDLVLKEFFIFSPSAYIEALGKVGLGREDYDLQMLVSPQLGGNVALLTALTNPAAGAFVWLVDRIFKNKLNKVIVYTYDVTGPWETPKVKRIVQQGSNIEPFDSGN